MRGLQQTPLVLHIRCVPENATISTLSTFLTSCVGAGPVLHHLTAMRCDDVTVGGAVSNKTNPAPETEGKPHPAAESVI